MRYRRMGRTGLVVSEICVGGWIHIGGDIPDEHSADILRTALKRGVNFFDTAEAYAEGRSEEVMGKAFRDVPRSEVVIATKVAGPSQERAPNAWGLSRKHIMEACDASLRRLGTDYIDLYQAHWWDPNVPLEESLGAFNDLVRAGKVLHIGCSNFTAEQVYRSLEISAREGWARFECLQPCYNLLQRGIEKEIMPLCKAAGIGIIPYSPLAGGMLTGKYTSDHRFAADDTRHDHHAFSVEHRARATAITEALLGWVADRGRTLAQFAIAWVLGNPAVTSAIVGAKTPEQARRNAAAGDWRLSKADLAEVETLLAAVLPGD